MFITYLAPELIVAERNDAHPVARFHRSDHAGDDDLFLFQIFFERVKQTFIDGGFASFCCGGDAAAYFDQDNA
ncbi:hypothetical protein A4D02_30850 [Niastella koreensis]|uniref:Uncharacterized protein n=1 Tax=Niastella koreensis TaxID=354356 RepID=A0ABX3NV21_9BACT|nr:hypothetical protein A4D02_30850 [Niastella koreensis]